jgi:signal transduction histidine kinase/CheY-like chemotaxis protein
MDDPPLQSKPKLLLAQEGRRVRVLTFVTLLFCGMGPLFIFRYYEMGIRSLSAAVLVAMLLGGLTLVWVRKGGSVDKGGVLVTSVLLVLLIYSNLCSGGIGDPNFGWLYVIPILGALLVSAFVGWVFTGVVFVLAVLFWLAPEYGFEIPNYVPPELRREQSLANRLSSIVAIGVMLAALAGQQKYSRGLLERVNNELVYEMNQRTEMQARMVRSERAASMGSLAAGLAHEINNPLTYVIGNLELLQGGLADGNGATPPLGRQESQAMISEAIEGSYRVASLVRDLKTFSHVSEEETEPVNLARIIDRAKKMTSNEIRHRAELEIDCPEGIEVLGNQGRILQIVINLLTNAAHAVAPGFSDSNVIRVSVRERESRVLLEVVDTGSGIDPDLADRIFEPFVTSKAVGFGMGMGLSITRNILRSMGGTIDVKYSSPEGTAFVVTFEPFVGEAEESSQASPATRLRSESDAILKILIIDDEELVLRFLASSLGHHDVSVESDGRMATQRIRGGNFDVILCDLMMPAMTGMEIFSELQREIPEATDRIIFMTGGVFVEEAEEFLGGMSGCWIEKPIDTIELETLIWKRVEALDAG